MSKRILKYQLDKPTTKLQLPIGAKVLSVANLEEELYLYVLVPALVHKASGDPMDNSDFTEERNFGTFDTGATLSFVGEMRFVGTTVFRSGTIVHHTFEIVD